MKFLLAMLTVYIFLGLLNASFAFSALQNFFEAFVKVFPFLVFVFLIIFLVNLFLKPESINRHLGYEAGIRGWIYAIVGSILITSPPYVTFPLLGDLKKHGMRYKYITVFLNSRNVQVAFLPVMAHYFGLLFTAVVSFYVILYAILSALIIEKLMGRQSHENPTQASGI